MLNEGLICPVCKKPMKSALSLGTHINKTGDARHQYFSKLRQENRCPAHNLQELYEKYRDDIESNKMRNAVDVVNDAVNGTEQIEESSVPESPKMEMINGKPAYLQVACPCKMTCEECFTDWKEDFYDGCSLERKQAYLKWLGGDEPQPVSKPEVLSKKRKIDDKNKEKAAEAPKLVKFFYSLIGGRSPNFPKEVGQVRIQLINYDTSVEDMMTIMRYMHRKGHVDLRFLTNSRNEALVEAKYINEMEVEGTAAYLVKRFYEGHGMKINMTTFVRDVNRVQEQINSGLTYDETKEIIDYMVKTNCTILNFIASKRTEALSQKKVAKVSSKIQDNPSFYNPTALKNLENDLKAANIKFDRIPSEMRESAFSIAKKIYMNGETGDFRRAEWAWRIGLDLDNDMYNVMGEVGQPLIEQAYKFNKNISDDQRKMLKALIDNFYQWLDRQRMRNQSSSATN